MSSAFGMIVMRRQRTEMRDIIVKQGRGKSHAKTHREPPFTLQDSPIHEVATLMN